MLKQGFDVEIIYWNLIFEGIPHTEDIPYAAVFPFLIERNYRKGDSQSRIRAILQSVHPGSYADRKSFQSFVERTQTTLKGIIDAVLQSYLDQEILLWDFSSKYYQWIPAAVMAEYIRKAIPDAKIVLGGMGTHCEANTLLSLFDMFDFGVWGEGESPLQALCGQLLEGGDEFRAIPRVVYNNEEIQTSASSQSSGFLDLNQAVLPDYDDYFEQAKGKIPDHVICLPIESSRGCHWNRCKFCSLNDGYHYRTKTPEKLLGELEQLRIRYRINHFALVDPDLVGHDIGRFCVLVTRLLDYNQKNQDAISFRIAEINPCQIDKETIRMMSQAGLSQVQIGFEALTDSLLEKMNKRTTVATNLYFVKHALKNGMSIQGANIIPGVPDETIDDVIESMDNLHYFRFCFDKERFSLPL